MTPQQLNEYERLASSDPGGIQMRIIKALRQANAEIVRLSCLLERKEMDLERKEIDRKAACDKLLAIRSLTEWK